MVFYAARPLRTQVMDRILPHTLHARDPRMGRTVYEADEKEMREVVERLGPPQRA